MGHIVKDGEYYYSRHRRMWGVWKAGITSPTSGVRSDDFIADFSTEIQAKRFVYKANGWSLNNLK